MSKSSISSQPPGRTAATMRRNAAFRSARCTSTNRACTRSKSSPGGSSIATSCWRTSTPPAESVFIHCTSKSVASTYPLEPTRSRSSRGTDGPPAPTSQQRHPGRIPSASTFPAVTGSNSADSAPNRPPASAAALSNR
ncbi:MAG TPA: hypothetical protein VGD73_04530 [Pseudonocardia sp.]